MGEVRKLPEIQNLNKLEVGTIITSLVEYEGALSLVKEEVEELLNKKISLETIAQIAAKYKDTELKALAEKFREDILTIPCARRSWRLKVIGWMINRARKDTAEWKAVKTDADKILGDTYESWQQPNYDLVLRGLLAAEKIMNNAERLELEWAKLEGSRRPTDLGDNDDYLLAEEDDEQAV